LITLAWFVAVPGIVYAQASITGVVKDTSGAVLPGVTVEASSPALIEKVRSAVTDGTGQYRIENLRPGVYAVAFTLTGFNTVKREGLELAGTFSATVNAELRVGALEETITVTGESPVVDVQNTTRQRVMDREVIDTIPRGGTVFDLATLVPGISAGNREQDVGGAGAQSPNYSLSIHGGGGPGVSVGGVSVAVLGSGGETMLTRMDPASLQEVLVDTAAVDAELPMGGVRLNQIPRDGGNTFNGTFIGSFANHAMQSSNFTQELRDLGLRTPNSIYRNWDVNPGFGGPIKRDRVWFYASARATKSSQYVAGLFYNRNLNDPNSWTYDPDPSRPVINTQSTPVVQLRLTWQATPKNKITLMDQEAAPIHRYCPQGTATAAPEGVRCRTYPLMRLLQGDWTAPITSRLLIEVGGVVIPYLSYDLRFPGLTPGLIGVVEQSTGLAYRSGDPYRTRRERTDHYRAVVSYITGTHAFKVGLNHRSGYSTFNGFDDHPLTYRVNNGVPNQLTQRTYPWDNAGDLDHDMGVFAQDKWIIKGLTLGYGVRYDYYAGSFPEQRVRPAVLAPTRDITFPAQPGLVYHDVTPKLGVAYDPFGAGKTAIKMSLNKYVATLSPEGLGGLPNPIQNLVVETTRSWNDANRNFVADCDLINTAANGECGQMANANFGKVVPGATYDPKFLRGWGKRNYNWEFSAGVQQELLPRVSADVSYFRRWFGNFFVVDDLAVTPADFDSFSITAPRDPRLPGGGGGVVSGLYNIKPAKFGVPTSYFGTLADTYGKQVQYWHGVDVTLNARPRPGILLQGGLSTGSTVTDNCEIVAKLPESSVISLAGGGSGGGLRTSNSAPSSTYCHSATKFLTQVKFLGSYTIPLVDVQFSGAFQSVPGPQILANYNAPNAVVAPSLGRNLSGNAANTTVNLVEPGAMFGERMNQLDLRFSKILRAGTTRTSLNVDLYNALNGNAVLRQNDNFAVWQRPTSILLARFVKLGVQFNF
jgi:hypothetical protein